MPNEIQNLLQKEIIIPSAYNPGEFISPKFLPDRTYRMTVNLKEFKQYVKYHHILNGYTNGNSNRKDKAWLLRGTNRPQRRIL